MKGKKGNDHLYNKGEEKIKKLNRREKIRKERKIHKSRSTCAMNTKKREVDSEEKREHEIHQNREGYHTEIRVIEERNRITSIREGKRKRETSSGGCTRYKL